MSLHSLGDRSTAPTIAYAAFITGGISTPGRTDQYAIRLMREALERGLGIAGRQLAEAYWTGKRVTADKEQAPQL